MLALPPPADDPWHAAKLRLLGDRPATRALRLSANPRAPATGDALAFARLAAATVDELALLPTAAAVAGAGGGARADAGRAADEPLGARNELAALGFLAAACAAQLAAYPTSLADDNAALRAGAPWPPAAVNRRHALLLVRGEKEVCAHYIDLARMARDAAALPRAALAAMLAGLRNSAASGDADIYMRETLLPLLLARDAGTTF